MAAVEDDFESWLSLKLKALNTDEGVFGSYIKGILDGEEPIDEKTEALEGILTEITACDISVHCREILDKWNSCNISAAANNESQTKSLENVEEKLVRLMETNAPSMAVQRKYTDEERRIREAILAQYSQTSDNECSGEGNETDDGGGEEGKENGLFKNTNASAVQQAEKEKRERAKQDSQKKKEKDREDRDKQKKEQQEKKEKRKTQKGERRR